MAKSIKPKLPRPVYFTWNDACASAGWSKLDSYDLDRNILTMGYLIKETKDCLTVAAAFHGDEANAVISVPRAWLTSKIHDVTIKK